MGGGGAGGRGAQARTNLASRPANPDPAAHREARPAGWAAEPQSGTGEARAERGYTVCELGMQGGESQAPLICLPGGEAEARGAADSCNGDNEARQRRPGRG